MIHTPSTDEARNTYAWAILQNSPDQTITAPERTRDRAYDMFDRMLDNVRREAKAEALRETAEAMDSLSVYYRQPCAVEQQEIVLAARALLYARAHTEETADGQ